MELIEYGQRLLPGFVGGAWIVGIDGRVACADDAGLAAGAAPDHLRPRWSPAGCRGLGTGRDTRQRRAAGGWPVPVQRPGGVQRITTFARSGVVAVRYGSSSVTKTGVALLASTVILATLQSRVDKVHIQAVETDPPAGSFTIFLTAAPDVDVPIGWLALS